MGKIVHNTIVTEGMILSSPERESTPMIESNNDKANLSQSLIRRSHFKC